jgi:hypothetical protein
VHVRRLGLVDHVARCAGRGVPVQTIAVDMGNGSPRYHDLLVTRRRGNAARRFIRRWWQRCRADLAGQRTLGPRILCADPVIVRECRVNVGVSVRRVGDVR